MRRSNILLVILIAMDLVASLRCQAEETNALQSMTVSVRAPKSSPTRHVAFVLVGTNKISFEMPAGFSLGGKPENGKLAINNVLMSAFISLKVGAAGNHEIRTQNADTLAARYPNGKFLSDVHRQAFGAVRRAYDIEWNATGAGVQKSRIIIIPSSIGDIEISLTSGREQFEDNANRFDRLLYSLRLNADEMHVLPPPLVGN